MINTQQNDTTQNRLVNDVLVILHRSLLQYMAECSPYVSADQTEKKSETDELIRFQHSAVTLLEELLEERRCYVDFGLYPIEFTDMQFLSLDYLLNESLVEARTIEQSIANAVQNSTDDIEANNRLKSVLKIQQEVITNLELMTSK